MQDRYFGDVGDFGKYGLLRALCGVEDEPDFRLGVVWYLFPDESHNADGKHLSYLRKEAEYRGCDENLFRLLREHLFDAAGNRNGRARRVLHAKLSGILPRETLYFEEPLSFPEAGPSSARLDLRREWFARALAATREAEVVFLDPDNGIECESLRPTEPKAPKYALWSEIEAFAFRGQSVVIYHHLGRNGTHAQQIERLLGELRARVPSYEAFALRFKRGTSRAYLILAAVNHRTLLRDRTRQMLSGMWNRHFEKAKDGNTG